MNVKNFLIGLFLFVCSLLVVGLLFEGYVRVTQTDGTSFDIEMWRYAKDMKQVSDIPGMGHEHVPGRSGTYMGVPVTINSHGWRDKEYSLEKPEGVTRIMMLGDSVTFGWGAPPEGITSHILEDLLNHQPDGRTYEVLNTGIGNSNTAMQTAYFLHSGYRFNPDLVILNYFINDAEPTPVRKENLLIEHFYSAVFFAGRWDILMRTFLGKSDWSRYYHDLYNANQPGWQATQEAISQLSAFCHKNKIPLLVVHYPELHQLSPYPFHEESQLVAKVVESQAIPFLDLLPAVIHEEPRTLWVTPTDAHPNGKAGALFAQQIFQELQKSFPQFF
ncbi:MAG TPA: hypothetical protein DD706_16415 [Nitrospiraceae bacterium]|nr:hypothetical protein [Nitrospiraceae bacterium]